MNARTVALLLSLLSAVELATAQVSPHGTITQPCIACHTTDSWRMRPDATFDHAQTGFPLDGQHAAVPCANCHAGLRFAGTSTACASCHTDIHQAALGVNCLRCHTTQSWSIPDMMQKHQLTRFPLLGRHATVNCADCHATTSGTRYVGTPTTCIGCHRTDVEQTTNPNHRLAGFSNDCSQCHTVSAFSWGSGFNHDLTPFPLTGAHRAVACVSCHTTSNFRAASTDCAVCHRSQYESTTDPNHLLGQFPLACQTCHTTVGWRPSTFVHDNTPFPLTGAHRAVACTACHVNNRYAGLPATCIDCHRADYVATTNPNHQSLGFPQNCQQCHSTAAWQPASFDHNATKLPLTGKHATIQCESCHVGGNYSLAFTDCYQCHSSDFQGAVNPNHVSGNFSHQCQTCHTTTAWQPASFDHSTTKFPLTGAHIAVACQTCHTNSNYQLVYSDCYQCHSTDFQGATNPNHVSGNFSHQCQTCHTTSAWQPASFDHSTTKFPLTGAHTSVACQSCHTNGNYQLVYADCYQCHQADYQRPTNPNHVTANFPHQCETCHTTTAWTPSTFDHDGQYFRIYSGAHQGKWSACTDCHTNQANYADFTCTTCHTKNSTDQDHSGVQNYQYLSSACYSCHRGV